MSASESSSHLRLLLTLATASGLSLLLKYTLSKEAANELKANLKYGFCGQNEICVSRLPVERQRNGSLSNLLGLFHERDAQVTVLANELVSSKKSWKALDNRPSFLELQTQNLQPSRWQKLRSADGSYEFFARSGTDISRNTLITLLVLSNARSIYEYSDSSGYRAAFGSWIGQWYINWRAGKQAVVTLRPHDSHSPASDVYPPTFSARVDRCVQMMAGVVIDANSPQSFSVAFPGRLAPGNYQLEYQKNGFGLSHGSRHLYNMNGGKVFEIDFLFPRPIDKVNQQDEVCLRLPSTREDAFVWLQVPPQEYKILEEALDKLPWANLSWSMHRGMRDLLLACARDRMDQSRSLLAEQLRDSAASNHTLLVEGGWNSDFARSGMAEMAASAVLAGRGNSGDAVRVVTALAEQIHKGTTEQRDRTLFWRSRRRADGLRRGPDEVVALVKCFVLEWSQDFNYQMYHQLPLNLLLG